MDTLLNTIRDVLGVPPTVVIDGFDIGAIMEYFVCATILLIVISSVFRLLRTLFA